MNKIKTGDILCFGTPDARCGFDGRWLVLDSALTNTGERGIFLVALGLIGNDDGGELVYRDIGDVSVDFFNRGGRFAKSHPGSQNYQGSELQAWCGKFLESHFSPAEKSAVISTCKSDAASVIPGLGIALPGAKDGTVNFDPAENVLRDDRLFPLSAEEAYNEKYGFNDDASRVAFYKGEAAGYWLRSPHIDTFPLDVGFVFPFGALMDYPVNGQFMFHMNSYARPAMNLDASKITGIETIASERRVNFFRVSFGGESNTCEYDTSLPPAGKTMDLKGIARKAVKISAAVSAALILAGIFMTARKVAKQNCHQ